MSDEIQQTRYDRLIRRVAGIIGPGSKVSQVITELFPMIDVENVPPELLILMGTQICMGGGSLGPIAGQACKGQLFNPVGSGIIITLTTIVVSHNVTGPMRWGRSGVVFGINIGTETFTDTRNDVTSRPVGEIHQKIEVALASGTNQTILISNTPLHIQPTNSICVLSPGFGFEVGSGVNNTEFHYGFNWRERPAEPSELNL